MSHTSPTATSGLTLQLMFDNALKTYQKRTKNDLRTHPLAARYQACDSPSTILGVFRQQVEEFNQSRSTDEIYERLMKWLDPTVNVLFAYSAAFGEGVGLVASPAKFIFAGIGVLFGAVAANGSRASEGRLIDAFERIEIFFRRLESYTKVSPTAGMMDISIKIMVEVLCILAIATKDIKQGRMKKYAERLMGRTGLEDALQRLDYLTQEETRMAIAQVLQTTHRVDERVIGVDDRVGQVEDRVIGVDDRVGQVEDRVANLERRVRGIGGTVASTDQSVKAVDDKVLEVMGGIQAILSRRKSI